MAVTRATRYANRIALYTPSRIVIGSRPETVAAFRSAGQALFLSSPRHCRGASPRSREILISRPREIDGQRPLEKRSSVIRSTVIILIDLSCAGRLARERRESAVSIVSGS